MALWRCKLALAALWGLLLFFVVVPTQARSPRLPGRQTTPVTVRVQPAQANVAPDGTVQVAVEVVDVSDLYAFSLVLAFDPAVVQVVDTDTTTDGVQVGLGTFMDPGAVILNLANNPAGVIEFAYTQLNPSPPQSGSGNLIVITFTGVEAGQTSPLIFLDVQLAQQSGGGLEANGVAGEIRVDEEPTPGPTATPIPTQPAGTALPTATFAATPPPTTTPVQLVTNTPAPTGQSENTATRPPATATPGAPTTTRTATDDPAGNGSASTTPADTVIVSTATLAATNGTTTVPPDESTATRNGVLVVATVTRAATVTRPAATTTINTAPTTVAEIVIGENVVPEATTASNPPPADASTDYPVWTIIFGGGVMLAIVAVLLLARQQRQSS